MASRLVMWFAVFLNATFLISAALYEISTGWVITICTVNIMFLFALNYLLTYSPRQVYLFGEHADNRNRSRRLLKHNVDNMGDFELETKQTIASLNEMGGDKFNSLVKTLKSDEMRVALSSANEKIQKIIKEEEDRNWIIKGVGSVAELKQKSNDIAAYGEQVLSEVIKYLNANQGGFFIVRNEHEDCYLEMIGSYAYGKKRVRQKRINPGEGLTGQVLYEKQMIYMTDIPKDYIKITSGLGDALPQCICILPLLFDGVIHGVLEIASFDKFTPVQLEYLKKISDSIGYNLGAIESHRKTEILLEESQKMGAEVISREEELRQNMEELQATQEQMKRKEYEMEAVLASLSTVELDVNGKIVDANEVFLAMSGFKIHDLIGLPYRSLISASGNDVMQYELMLSNIVSGRTFSGEFKLISSAQKEIWMAGNFTPVLDGQGKLYKIMVISVFTTQDKEKLHELQQFVSALKSCLAIAEINSDVSFKTANDLFLNELGMKRLELKNVSPKSVLSEDSFKKIESYILDANITPETMNLEIKNKDGNSKSFNTTVVNIGTQGSMQKKGLLILRNPV